MQKERKSTFEIFVISLKLLAICAFVAFLVSGVNHITKEVIAGNEMRDTYAALAELFGNEAAFENITDQTEPDKGVTAVYRAAGKDNELIGYCTAGVVRGFRDVIQMLVAVDGDHAVIGVRIISMSETKGIGTKILEESFLSQFVEKSKHIAYSQEEGGVDLIAGATESSRPVVDGVNAALENIERFLAINREGGDS